MKLATTLMPPVRPPGTERAGMTAAIENLASEKASKPFRAEVCPGNPEDPRAIATQLLAYLRRRLRLSRLEFLTPPVAIPHGWETYTYSFQLQPCTVLPKNFCGPLIL